MRFEKSLLGNIIVKCIQKFKKEFFCRANAKVTFDTLVK